MKILVCGMPRSMTTWAVNAIRQLVASPDLVSLWLAPGSAEEGRFLSDGGLVMGKCHHFTPSLAAAADVIVYSYRDLRTAAVSAYRKFRAPGTREQLEAWVKAEDLWRQHAHAILRYESAESDPVAAVGMLRALLRERAPGLALSPLADAQIAARIDAEFAGRSQASGESFDPATLILPAHRTFQPPVDALPAYERELHQRVEAQFAQWLRSRGYLDGPATVEDRRAHATQQDRDRAMSAYVAALMAETASKEAQIARAVKELQDSLVSQAQANAAMRKVIEEFKEAVDHYRRAFKLTFWIVLPINYTASFLWKIFGPLFRFFMPRLGVLHQHSPRPLALPQEYAERPHLQAAPRISIVTPSFRQGAFIERTIVSVLGQGYPDLEYVVQDGASQDGTREILQRYADRLSSWESLPDNGQTEAINRGFSRTTGEIMAWLNSDDILLPGALHAVADYFNRHPGVDVVYGNRILIDENDRQIGRWIMPPHNDEVLSWVDYVPQETMFFRRAIWEKAGGRVDESFRFAMDWDLLVRFRDAGARFAAMPRFIGGFRVHPQQKTSASIADVGLGEMNRIRERVLGRVPSPLEIRKAVMPYLMRHVAWDLRWKFRTAFGLAA